jgi:hypothetical protein
MLDNTQEYQAAFMETMVELLLTDETHHFTNMGCLGP